MQMKAVEDMLEWYDFSDGGETISNIWAIRLIHISHDLKIIELNEEPGANCFVYVEFEQFKGRMPTLTRRRIITDGDKWYPISYDCSMLPKDRNEIRSIAHIKRLDPSLDFPITALDRNILRRAIKKALKEI